MIANQAGAILYEFPVANSTMNTALSKAPEIKSHHRRHTFDQ